MVIVTNTSEIMKGEGYKLIDRFDKVGKIEAMEGFLGLEVLLTDNRADYDEVTVSTRWDSLQAFKNWTKSDAFKESHSPSKGNGRPEYVLNNTINYYQVKITRNPIVLA